MLGCSRPTPPCSNCGKENHGEFHDCWINSKTKNPQVSEAQLWEHSDGERRLILKVTRSGVRYAEAHRGGFGMGYSYSIGYESADVWEYWAAKAKFVI